MGERQTREAPRRALAPWWIAAAAFVALWGPLAQGSLWRAAGLAATCLAGAPAWDSPAEPGPGPRVRTACYGLSGLGQPLLVTLIDSGEGANGGSRATVLLVFEVHAFEDAYPRDGLELVARARAVIRRFCGTPSALGPVTLAVVTSANPDGLVSGTTNLGPGRCQISRRIDINRDFPAGFRPAGDPRYRTAGQPLASPEARALRDLVLRLRPAVVVDFHGWEAAGLGDAGVCTCFARDLGIGYRGPGFPPGSFAAWVRSQGCRAALIEYRWPDPGRDDAEATVLGLEQLLAGLAGGGVETAATQRPGSGGRDADAALAAGATWAGRQLSRSGPAFWKTP